MRYPFLSPATFPLSNSSASLVSQAGSPMTGGWDAVLAIDSAQATALFFQQYLANGPMSRATALQAIVSGGDDSTYYLLDFSLGPPDISFGAGNTASLSMYILGGSFTTFTYSASADIVSVIQLSPNASQLTGALNLTQVTGTDTIGTVEAQLGSASWTVQIEGVEAGSTLATAISEAIQAYFSDNAVSYQLGTVQQSTIPPSLQPTSMSFATQTNSTDSTDVCLLVFITTDGSAKASTQLSQYPLAEGYTAGLMVSNRVIFAELLPSQLPTYSNLQAYSITAEASPSSPYHCIINGGVLNLGDLSSEGYGKPYSSNSSGTPEAIEFSASGLTISPQVTFGGMYISWTDTISQGITYKSYGVGTLGGHTTSITTTSKYNVASLTAEYADLTTAIVDSQTAVITFSGQPTSGVNYNNPPTWWQKYFGGEQAFGSLITSPANSALGAALATIPIPKIDVFALSNLLFPAGQQLSLSQAAVPCDLLIAGQVIPGVTIAPATITLGPGGTTSFAATIPGVTSPSISWVEPNVGEMSSTGDYSAPGTISAPSAVVITAMNSADTTQTGSALVILTPTATEGTLQVVPGNFMVTAGQSQPISASSGGTAVDVKWSLSPNIGSVAQNLGASTYSYTAPAQITSGQTVTLTATSSSDTTQTGSATVTLASVEAIEVSLSTPNPTIGEPVLLVASSQDVSDFTWTLFPSAAGTLTPDPQGATAVFVASDGGTEVLVTVSALQGGISFGTALISTANLG